MTWWWTRAEPSSKIGIGLSAIHKIVMQSLKVWKCMLSGYQNVWQRYTRTTCGNCQSTYGFLWMWKWNLPLPDLYKLWDMAHFIWTWPEDQTVMWMVSPVITTSVQISTGTGELEVMFSLGYDNKGILIAHAFLPGMTVNIACCFIGRTVTDWFERWNFQVLEHSLYSPNMRLCNSWPLLEGKSIIVWHLLQDEIWDC